MAGQTDIQINGQSAMPRGRAAQKRVSRRGIITQGNSG